MHDPSESDVCGISHRGVDRRLGLNLTYRTLAAILKYDVPIPLRRKESDALKKGYYASERGLVDKIKQNVGSPEGEHQKFKTIECQIMDIADDIAYSTYDLEDTMKADFTHPLALLAKIGNESLFDILWSKVKKEINDVTKDEVFAALTDILIFPDLTADDPEPPGTPITSRLIAGYEASKLIAVDGAMRSRFSSAMIDGFVRGVSVTPRGISKGLRFSEVEVRRDIRVKIEALKHLNYLLTIMSPRLKVVEYRGYEVVRTIFETLDSDEGNLLLPDDVQVMYNRLTDTDSKKRMICDFVAGMTDRYAVEFYGRLRETGASIFKPI